MANSANSEKKKADHNRIPVIESEIYDEGGNGCKMVQIHVNGYRFGFSVNMMEPVDQEWIKDVIARQLREVFQMGWDTAIKDVKEARNKYLNLIG